jgi:hypothetical protein
MSELWIVELRGRAVARMTELGGIRALVTAAGMYLVGQDNAH